MGVMVCLWFIQRMLVGFYKNCTVGDTNWLTVTKYQFLKLKWIVCLFLSFITDKTCTDLLQRSTCLMKTKGTAYHREYMRSHLLFYQARFALVLGCLFVSLHCRFLCCVFACFSSFCVVCPVYLDCIFQIIPCGFLLRVTKIVKFSFLNRIILPILLTECLYYTQMLF